MPLHNRLVQKAVESNPKGGERQIASQYKAAIPFLNEVTDLIGNGEFHVNVTKELNEGNPNVEKLMLYRAGYEQAMKTFLAYIDPT